MPKCGNCNTPFQKREAKQRFCCRECSMTWWKDYRRQAMAAFRQLQEEPAS